MAAARAFITDRPRRAAAAIAVAAMLALALAVLGPALLAQIEGDRGIAPIASNGDFEVTGIEVNVTADTAEEARIKGWEEAQRKAWERLWASSNGAESKAPALADGAIASMVSAVVIEREQIGPKRYIATLGVIFDRARAGQLLGLSGDRVRSAPMLVIPVLYEGGVASVFETRTPWQRAWAEFRTGESTIDYVRPNGGGADSLLLTAGQISRRSRSWWRLILDEFGASDVIMPIARLERQYPGGPVRGRFSARYGPDNRYLGSFTMTANSDEQLPMMLTRAIRQLDGMYQAALANGTLAPDPTLVVRIPVDQALIDAVLAREAARLPAPPPPPREAPKAEPSPTPSPTRTPGEPIPIVSYSVQLPTPDAAAVDAALAGLRGAPGVQGVAPGSVAIGGTSVIRVTFIGTLDELAQSLRSRGWQVSQSGGGLSIRR